MLIAILVLNILILLKVFSLSLRNDDKIDELISEKLYEIKTIAESDAQWRADIVQSINSKIAAIKDLLSDTEKAPITSAARKKNGTTKISGYGEVIQGGIDEDIKKLLDITD